MTPDTFDEQAAALREIMDRHHGYGTLWMDALREAHALGRASGWWAGHAKIIEDALLLAWDNMAFVKRREPELYPALQWVRRLVTDDQRASMSGERDGERVRLERDEVDEHNPQCPPEAVCTVCKTGDLPHLVKTLEALAAICERGPINLSKTDASFMRAAADALGACDEQHTDRNAGREAAEVSDPDALIANARLFVETARTEPEKVVAGMVEDLLSVIYEARTELEKWDLFAGDLRKEVDESRVKLRAVEAALKGGA